MSSLTPCYWQKDSQIHTSLSLHKRIWTWCPFLSARDSENNNLDHVISTFLSGIKIQLEKNCCLLQKFLWKHLTQNWEKKITQNFFCVGDNFPKILQFYSNFAHVKTGVQQKEVFHKFHSLPHLHWQHKYGLSAVNSTGMLYSLITSRPTAPIEATMTLGSPSTWRQTGLLAQ